MEFSTCTMPVAAVAVRTCTTVRMPPVPGVHQLTSSKLQSDFGAQTNRRWYEACVLTIQTQCDNEEQQESRTDSNMKV